GVATRDYTITQADIDAGKVTNSALAMGQDPDGNNVQDVSGTSIANDDSTVTTLPTQGKLAFVKTAVYNGDPMKAKVGDKITYTFTVTNMGNVTVSNIGINDAKLGLTNLALTPSTLLPNGVGVATQDYTITQADIDAKMVTNTAIAKGKDPSGNDIEDTSGTAVDNDDSTVTTLPTQEKLAFVKTAVYNGDPTKAKVGDKITYTFTVTNTGNVTVNNIGINDAKLGLTNLALTPSTLLPNGVGVATQEYAITQADIDAKMVTNTAIAKGKDPSGTDVEDISGTAVDNDDSTVTTVPTQGKLAFVKTAVYNGDPTKAKVGDKITYTFTVTNTGNVTVNNIVINDAKLGVANMVLVPNVLAPNAVGVATQDYTITQVDIDAGQVTNTAIAKGQDPSGADVEDTSGTAVDNDDSTVTTVPTVFSIALVKTAVLSGSVAAGATITYTFSVTNTGNGTVKNIVVTDPMVGLTIPVATIATLASGQTNTMITGTYSVKQSDIDAGQVVNSALAVGKDVNDNEVRDISGTTVTNDTPTTTPLLQSPSISFTKIGTYQDTNGDGMTSVGDKIQYAFEIKNVGNTALTNVTITDTKAMVQGSVIPVLAVGSTNSTAYTAEYVITQADINAGVVYNLATITATTPVIGLPTITAESTYPIPYPVEFNNPSCPNCTVTLLAQSPKIALIMKGTFQDENGDGQAQIGETIYYNYTVMNMGNVPLSNVWIEDTMTGHDENDGTISLPIGGVDTTSFTSVYSITQEDIIRGMVWNQSRVSGRSPLGVIVQDLSDDNSPLEDDGTVVDANGCEVRAFNAVSPDDDGLNDFFYVRGMDCYPDNSVQIFDRWGVKVYDVRGYDNAGKAFRGISEGRVTVNQSQKLPSGTYFYVIKYIDKDGKGFDKTGYLHLIND
ncbi:gliding motility-associated C-terminal domain-containing protein, partial [Flavobacterium sp. UMI-01]|uniref:DUF7507 domain-containing protein n=2 Tax=Flavobacterium sp. UMI-01 TaxID=1441053 RepID=UPI001C7D673A